MHDILLLQSYAYDYLFKNRKQKRKLAIRKKLFKFKEIVDLSEQVKVNKSDQQKSVKKGKVYEKGLYL